MTATLQREHWNNQPTYLGDLFRVSKARGDKTLSAVCKLWTHALGWEVRLEIDGDLQRGENARNGPYYWPCDRRGATATKWCVSVQ